MELSKEQKEVVELDYEQPLLIKGCPGSGKTLVSLHRYDYIKKQTGEKILFLTYTNELVNYIKNDLSKKCEIDADITTSNKFYINFLMSNKIKPKIIDFFIGQNFNNYISNFIVKNKDESVKYSLDFIKNNVMSYIKNNNFSKDEYKEKAKTGRGNKKSDWAEPLYNIYEKCNNYLHNDLKCYDWDDIPLLVLENKDKIKKEYIHLILDETQDFSIVELAVLQMFLKNKQNVTINGDMRQRIYYKSSFDLDSNFKFESKNLTTNYRNNKYIVEFSKCIAKTINIKDKLEYKNKMDFSNFTEKPPFYNNYNNLEEEVNFIKTEIEQINKDESIAILCRTNSDIKKIQKVLKINRGIVFTTFHSSKGCEYDNVFAAELNDDFIEVLLKKDEDQDSQDNIINAEKKLLYVVITRTRNKLYLLSSGKPSRILEDLKIKKYDYLPNGRSLTNITSNNEIVKSKSEVIIANELKSKQIQYEYEKEIVLDNIKIHPDFTIKGKDGDIYWEHLGMLDIFKYKQDWDRKEKLYEKNKIIEGKNLFTTDERGGFDTNKILKTIDKIKSLM